MPRILTLDFETRSACSLDSYRRYAQHPTTGVLCIGLQWHDMPHGRTWVPAGKVATANDECPTEVRLAIEQGCLVYAHNVAFDRTMWQFHCVERLGWPVIPFEQWRCTLAVCCYYALPAALGKAANALELGKRKETKTDPGKRALGQCCKPRKPRRAEEKEFQQQGLPRDKWPLLWYEDQERLERVYTYCRTDVGVQTELLLRLGDLPPDRLRDWQLDQKINERGVPVDFPNLLCAAVVVDQTLASANEEMRTITNGAVEKVTSRDQIMEYLHAQSVDILALDKESVEGALDNTTNPVQGIGRRVLELRQLAGKSSLAKIEAMLDYVDTDCRIRHGLRWHGAAPGRWTGQGVQWHNFPRECLKAKEADELFSLMESVGPSVPHFQDFADGKGLTGVPDLLTRILRALVKARGGARLIISDFSAVEARIVSWLASCRLLQKAFKDGECVYCQFGSRATGLDVKKGMPERQLGKASVLGLGYQMGAEKFVTTCGKQPYYITLTEERAKELVTLYRSTYPEVPSLWKACEDAMVAAIKHSTVVTVAGGKLAFGRQGDWAWTRLPSGRCIWYFKPELKMKRTPWGAMREQATYMSIDSFSKKWVRTDTYGGKLVENATQATAACLLSAAIQRVEDAGFPVIVSVHDEVVGEVPEAEKHFDEFHRLMEVVPPWATGCYVGAESHVSTRYGK